MKNDLWFPPDVFRKLFLYAEMCDDEISGIGLVREEDTKFICEEVLLIDQEVSAAHTDITPDGLSATLTQIGQERPDTWGRWKVWWHSHKNMSAAFSTQDDETLRELARVSGDWFFGLVINKRGDSQFYVAVQEPIPLFGKLDEAKELRSGADDELRTAVEAEIAENVHRKVVTAKKSAPLSPTPSGMGKDKSKNSTDSGQDSGDADDTVNYREELQAVLNEGDQGIIQYEGVRADSATLGLCLMCGGPTDWRQATKNRLFLACADCDRGITNCSCRIARDNPAFVILKMYWEEKDGIEAVSAAAKQLSIFKPVQESGRKRRRAGNTRKLGGSKSKQDGAASAVHLG